MKVKKRRIALTTLMAVFMMFALVLTIMPVDVTAAEESGFIATATKLTTAGAGKELSGDYYVEPNTTLTIRSSKAGVSGIKVKGNSTLTIYIPAGSKLVVYGGNASTTTGAGAGIEVGSTSTLKVVGEGTLEVYGGNAANGGAGAKGDNASWEDDKSGDGKTAYCYIPDSGYGGYGGGGAGAGIGTKGGNGGGRTDWKYGFLTRSQPTDSFKDRNYSGSNGHAGVSGASANSAGQIYISATINCKDVYGGSAGTAGGAGGSRGNSAGESDDNDIRGLAGGAGGGGGGAGKAGAKFGTGGGGGGGGGAGGAIGYAWSCYYVGAGGGGGGAGAVGGTGGAWSHDSQLPDHDCGSYTDGKTQSSWSGVTGGSLTGGDGGTGARVWMRWKKSKSASWELVCAGNGGKGGSAGSNCTENGYEILYDVNIVNGETTTLYYASANKFLPDTLEVPTQIGYTFNGFVGEDGNTYYDALGIRTSQAVTADTKTITPSFTVNSYGWVVDSPSGSNGGGTSGTASYGDAAITLETPQLDGYLFRGWRISAISGSINEDAYYISAPKTRMIRTSNQSAIYLKYSNGTAQTAGFEKLGDSITLYNLSSSANSQLKIEEVWRLNSFTVTFKDFDGKTIGTQNGVYSDKVTAPKLPAHLNEYYTYTFKYWKCNIDDQPYTSENLPDMGYFLDYESELGDKVYDGVEFTAVYDIEYKKGIHFVGSLGNTGLESDGTLVLDSDATNVDVITNFNIELNDGVASLLLIPEYDASVFTIEAVSVNGVLYTFGEAATSSEILNGFTVTFTGNETASDTFKILIENETPNDNTNKDVFIQIIYRMANAVGGKYEFGFVTASPTDTDSITHGDRSEAYGTYDPDKNSNKDAWEFNELDITVDSTAIKVVIRADGEITIEDNQEFVYNSENMTAAELSQAIAGALQFYYNGFDKMEKNTLTIKWYNENGELLAGPPKDAGKYKIGISAARTTYYNAVEEQFAYFEIKPYTIYVDANDQTFEYTGQNIVINTAASKGVLYTDNNLPLDPFVSSELYLDSFVLDGDYKSAGEHTGAIKGVIVFADENDAKNYNIVDVTGTLIITQAANDWNGEPADKSEEYTGEQISIDVVDPKFGAPIVEYLVVTQDGEGNRVETWTTVAPTDAGTYPVRIRVEETTDFSGLEYEVTLVIKKKVISAFDFTFDPGSKIYNGAEQYWLMEELGYSTSPENIHLMNFVTFKGVEHVTDCINVGVYTINAVLEITNNNYTFVSVKNGEAVEVDSCYYPVTVEILPLEIIIDATDQSAEYSGSEPDVKQGENYITILLKDGSAAPSFIIRDFFGVKAVYESATQYVEGTTYYVADDEGNYSAVSITAEQFEANKALSGTENYVDYCVMIVLDNETITLEKSPGEIVGLYAIIAKLGDNSNYVIGGYEGTFEIYKKAILLPTLEDSEYNNTVQQPKLPSDASDIYRVITGGYKDAGIYTVVLELINPNYTWKVYYDDRDDDFYISDENQTVGWEIVPKEVVVTLPNAIGSYEYATDYSDYLWANGGTILWADPEKMPYDGDELIIGWGFEEGYHFTAGTSHQADVMSVSGAAANNYTVVREGGYVSITKRIIDEEYLSGKVNAEVKYYTGSKLVLNVDEFIITLTNLLGEDVIDVESILEIADNLVDANGILDDTTGEFAPYATKPRYYVNVKLKLIDTDNYEFAEGADSFDAEAFIAKAYNSWVESPTVDHDDITNITGSAKAEFYKGQEPTVEFFLDSGCTQPATAFVTGTVYYVRFTVEDDDNYFGLEEIFSFSPSKITLRIPTVYFGEMVVNHGVSYKTPYNGADRKFDGIVTNPAYKIVYSHNVWKDVGVYTVTLILNNENGQYMWSNGSTDNIVFTLEITKASLSISADYQEIFYKENAPTYTVTVNGLQGGETLEELLGAEFADLISCEYGAGYNAGEYDIVLSREIADKLKNYTVTLENGKLNVKPLTFTYNDISTSDNKTFEELIQEGLDFIFNNEKKEVTATKAPTELEVDIVYKDANGVVVDEIKDAGEYTAEITLKLKDGYSSTNYNVPEMKAISVTVAKASITITVKGQEAEYTGNNLLDKFPLSSADGYSVVYNNVSPFVDSSAYVTKLIINNGTYINAGRYAKVISVDHTYDSSNYDVEIVLGDLTITKAKNEWVTSLYLRSDIVYNGSPLVLGEDFSSDPKFGDSEYSFYQKVGESWIKIDVPPTAAGEYRVSANVKGTENYEGLDSEYIVFTIDKKTIVMGDITFNNGTFTYNGQEHSIFATGYPSGCEVKYVGNAKIDAGTYTVTAIFTLTDDVNYRFESEDGNTKTAELVIEAVKVTITEISKESMYGNDLAELEYQISFGNDDEYRDFYLGEFGNVTISTDARPGKNVGSYDIFVVFGENDNYDVEIVDGTYKISKFIGNEITLSAESVRYLMDLDYTVSALRGEQGIVITFSSSPDGPFTSERPTKAGTYYIRAEIVECDNYDGDVEIVPFRIDKAKLSAVEISSIVYNKDTATWEIVTTTTDNIPIDCTVTYLVDGTYLADACFQATHAGSSFTIIAFPSDDKNYEQSNAVALKPVYSVKFDDLVANHSKQPLKADLDADAFKEQLRFEGQAATNPLNIDSSATPVIEGYTFSEWRLNGVEYGFSEGVYGDITILAAWDINYYTVKFYNDVTTGEIINGVFVQGVLTYKEIEEYSVAYGSYIPFITDPTKPSNDIYQYAFAYWSDQQLGGEYDVYNSAVKGDISLYAIYSKIVIGEFTVTYMISIDGGPYEQYMQLTNVPCDSALEVLKNVAWFTVDAWYTDEARTNSIGDFTPACDIVLYGAYLFDIGAGDVNGDREIDIDDVTLYRRWVVGGYDIEMVQPGSEWEIASALDDNFSGKVYYLARVSEISLLSEWRSQVGTATISLPE